MKICTQYSGRSRLIRSSDDQILLLCTDTGRDPPAFAGQIRRQEEFRGCLQVLSELLTARPLCHTPEATSSRHQHHTAPSAVTDADLKRLGDTLRRRLRDDLFQESVIHWRHSVPLDPLITVANDALLFEAMAPDGLSWACLFVDRGCFEDVSESIPGTTRFQSSGRLFDDLQTMSCHQPLRIIAAVETTRSRQKSRGLTNTVNLPDGWAGRTACLQAAMTEPHQRIPLGLDAMYSVLVFLRRNRARRSPTTIRFELSNRQTPILGLEPWNMTIESRSTRFVGTLRRPVRILGRRQLLSLAGLLPLATGFDVYLSELKMPSCWVVHLTGMRLVLGLNSPETFDWSFRRMWDAVRAKPGVTTPSEVAAVTALRQHGTLTMHQLAGVVSGDLNLARQSVQRAVATGQVLFDLHSSQARWRPLYRDPLQESQILEGHSERVAAFQLDDSAVVLDQSAAWAGGQCRLRGRVNSQPCDITVDADGRILDGACRCSWQLRTVSLQNPCRHLLTMRDMVWRNESPAMAE